MVVAKEATRLKKIMEQERVFEFLTSLNPELNQVRVQILFHPSGRFMPM